jgi:hypothetical protein
MLLQPYLLNDQTEDINLTSLEYCLVLFRQNELWRQCQLFNFQFIICFQMLHRNVRLRRHPCHPWRRRPLRGKTGPRNKNQKVTFYKKKKTFFVKNLIIRLLFFLDIMIHCNRQQYQF